MSSRSDKSTSTASTPTTPIPPNVTKLCHIIKRPDFDGYGFNLHSEKVKPGQFIGKVDPKSPAEEAGLKEGDRIIEVNGVPIGSETHKQVVQRIKAISCEVRLLLIDVDGKGDAPKSPVAAAVATTTSTKTPQTPPASPAAAAVPALPTTPPPPSVTQAMANGNGDLSGYEGTKQELPGESSNISSISMVSTKRISSASSASSNHSHSADVVDRASVDSSSKQNGAVPLMAPMPDLTNGIMDKQQQQERQEQHAKEVAALSNNNNSNNFNNNMMPPSQAAASTAIIASEKSAAPAANVPPPPSAITATNQNNNNMGNGNSNGNANGAIMQSTTITTTQSTVTTTSQVNNNGTGVIRAGSLNLPMTAAEMRAKLMSKKKYDPKSEGVDLKKKFEIIQKL